LAPCLVGSSAQITEGRNYVSSTEVVEQVSGVIQ